MAFNIDAMEEVEDSANHRITYITLRDIIVHIKHGGIKEDSSFKKERKEEPIEQKDIKIDKVLKNCQNLVEDIKEIMTKNDDVYGIE